MTIRTDLLERSSTREALLEVGRELAQQRVAVDISAVQEAMGWQWFEAVYAVSFHNAWGDLGIPRNAPGITWH